MGMAVKQKHVLSIKIDDTLQDKLDLYVESTDGTKSKVLKKALKEYLDKNLQPANRKNMNIVSK